jgi:hypothetical protein
VLRDRAARAWEAVAAVQTAISPATIRGGSGRAGATSWAARVPTCPKAWRIASAV